MAVPYCAKKHVTHAKDMNTVYAYGGDDGEEVCMEGVENVKVPVKLLLVCIMHMVQGDSDSRLKSLYRLFKECVECVSVEL